MHTSYKLKLNMAAQASKACEVIFLSPLSLQILFLFIVYTPIKLNTPYFQHNQLKLHQMTKFAIFEQLVPTKLVNYPPNYHIDIKTLCIQENHPISNL